MAKSRDSFGLSCGALGAGIGLYAVLITGSSGGNFAFIPYVLTGRNRGAVLCIEAQSHELVVESMIATPVVLCFVPLHVVGLSGITVGVDDIEGAFVGSGLYDPLVVHSTQSHAGVLDAHADHLSVVREGVEVAFLAYSPYDGSIGSRDLSVNRRNSNTGVIEAGAVVSAESNVSAVTNNNHLVAYIEFRSGNENISILHTSANGAGIAYIGMLVGGCNGFGLLFAALVAGEGLYALVFTGGIKSDLALIPAVFAGRSDSLCLGLVAQSAGKGLFACSAAVGLLGNGAFIPLMLMGLECGNNDRCKLCTGSVGVGGEDEALALGHAVDDAFADGPCKGLSGILGNVLTVLEGIQSTLCLGLTHIAPDHGDQLLTGNALVGAEGGLGNAVDHAGILCPCDRIGIPVCCEILKGGGATYRGFALYAIEDSCSHSTGAGALRIKEILPDAAHIACLGDSLYELGIPSVILHIRKGTHLGAEHGRHNAEKHSDNQKQRHDSLECVFHVVSSLDFQIFREQAHFGYYIISIFSYKRKVNFLFFSFFTILFLKMLKYELFLVQSCRFIPLFLYYWLK